MNNRAQPGFVFVIVLMILSAVTFLVMHLVEQSDSFIVYSRAAVDRIKTRELALSGIDIAMSQLAQGLKNQEVTQGKDKKPDNNARLLSTVLPIYGQCQTFNLSRKNDGINGSINICISSEDAKVDLNQIYDFKDKKFVGQGQAKGDYRKIMEQLFSRIEQQVKGKDLFIAFEKFLKQRQDKLNDVTELLTLEEFKPFREYIFYAPPTTGQGLPNRLYLCDIFTTWSGKKTLEPWFLTAGFRALLQFNPIKQGEREKVKLAQDMATEVSWDKVWDQYMVPLYGKKYTDVPEFIRSMLATKFGATTFSVLSYGKIGRVTQKVVAIVQLSQQASKQKENGFDVVLKKLYWL